MSKIDKDTEEEDDEYLGADMDANDYFMKIDPAGKVSNMR